MPPSHSVNSINHPVPGAYPGWKPFPNWLNDGSKIPKEYIKLFHNCIPPNRFEEIPDTGLVYILLRASGLSNDVLGAIWAIVNRTQPGQLTKVEFFAAMALVAFAQVRNFPKRTTLYSKMCSFRKQIKFRRLIRWII